MVKCRLTIRIAVDEYVDSKNGRGPTHVREQLDKLQRSATFAGSSRLLALLRFLIDETLDGRGSSIKEAVIGNAVYGREPPYDPRIDFTVRVEARRLRRKLNEYYESEGQHDF